MLSGRADKPMEVDASAKYMGDGIYMWINPIVGLVIQRQPQYSTDENYWRLILTIPDVEEIVRMSGHEKATKDS